MPQWLFRKITTGLTNNVCEPVYILYVQVMLNIQNIYNALKNIYLITGCQVYVQTFISSYS